MSRLTIWFLGTEVLDIRLGEPAPAAPDPEDTAELVKTSNHQGDFGFCHSDNDPYWNPSRLPETV